MPTRIYGKTADGAAEVAQRSARLSLVQRRLLILIDGQRGADELGALLPAGAYDEALTQLLALELIAAVHGVEAETEAERDPLDVPTLPGG